MAGSVPGVADARVFFSSGKLMVRLNLASELPSAKTPEAVFHALTKRASAMGFQIAPQNAPVTGEGEAATSRKGFLSAAQTGWKHPAFLCGAFLLAGLAAKYLFHASETISSVLLGISVLCGVYKTAQSGLAALRERVISINLLVSSAAVGAMFLRQWEEAATVIALYLLGVCLESAASERARRSLHTLIEACPDEAIIQTPDLRHEIVSAASLQIGDLMVVKPGARIAADGKVVSGASPVNQAALTGEALPSEKRRGDSVFAGSINGNGSLLVAVEAAPENSALARVLQMAEAAHAHKSKNQDALEKFGRIYTPVILVSAAAIALLGPLILPGLDWLHRALTLLVVACPCALIAATPMTHVCAVARASRFGVLVKGGRHLETLADANALFFDKTGTLTSGNFHVTDVLPEKGVDKSDVLRWAAAAEQSSEHPLARAIVSAASGNRNGFLGASHPVHAKAGRGVAATLADGASVLVGTEILLREAGIGISEDLQIWERQLIAEGKTASFVAVDNTAIGIIGVSDTRRPEAASVIAGLQKTHQIALLSGDNEGAALRVAENVGISDVRARLLPEQKRAFVEQEAASGKVVFIGDGLNDAPALAAASVGIALRGAGIEASLEAADVVLMGDDLSRLLSLFRLARVTKGVIRANLVFAVGTMVVLLIGSVSGRLNLSAGIFAHEGGTLLVLLNGLRLLSPRLTRLD